MKIFKLGLVYLIALAIASIAVGSIMLPKASAGTTKTTPPTGPTTITHRKAGKTQQEYLTSGNPSAGLPSAGLPGRQPLPAQKLKAK
jgi:hypothetical protein